MRYAVLLYASDEAWAALSPAEQAAVHARYAEFEAAARASGALVEGAELRPAATATTVRVRDGDTLVSDGPFAETREQLGGFFVVDCESLDEAIELAAQVPVAATASVEIRPLVTGEEASA